MGWGAMLLRDLRYGLKGLSESPRAVLAGLACLVAGALIGSGSSAWLDASLRAPVGVPGPALLSTGAGRPARIPLEAVFRGDPGALDRFLCRIGHPVCPPEVEAVASPPRPSPCDVPPAPLES